MNLILQLVLLQWGILAALSKIIVDVDEEVYDCGNSLPISADIFNNIKFTLDEDDVLTLNGKVELTQDYEAPIGLNVRSQHLERGQWRTGFISMTMDDLCPQILDPIKPWYFITKELNQTFCPYKKGHVEILDNLKHGTAGIIIPFYMLGDWKFFYEVSTKRNEEFVKECSMLRVFLTDG